MAELSRRRFLAGIGGLAALQWAGPVAVRAGRAFGAAAVDPAAAARRRIVVVSLFGGNDGLNTVVPMADVGSAARRSVYEKVRPALAYPREALLALDRGADAGQALGLNPRLRSLHRLYGEGRVAIVQGADYPEHNYSHFTSSDIWQSGQPDRAPTSGWLGRHLDRADIEDGELRALSFGTDLPLILRGEAAAGVPILGVRETRFADGTDTYADVRHAALAKFAGYPADDPLRRSAGELAEETVGLVNAFESVPTPPTGPTPLARALLGARVLFEQGMGLEVVFVEHAGYDTHTTQQRGHEALLDDLDGSLDAFFTGSYHETPLGLGPMSPDDAAKTLVVVYSEFGRRVGENGAGQVAGTDHGAAGPVLLIGPAAAGGSGGASAGLVGGLHGDHPALGTKLAPADNLRMTTDFRSVYAAVLADWLGDPDPAFSGIPPLPGLFSA